MAGQGVEALYPEIWALILRFVRNPIPPPLSRPPRSSLRQPNLCAAARTCSLFASICTPLLYHTVVIDDLSALLFPSKSPSSPTGPLRRSLHLIQHLHIEYRADEPTTYHDILSRDHGFWQAIGCLDAPEDGPNLGMKVADEVRRLTLALEDLMSRGPRSVFPRLRNVALCSINGVQSDVWKSWDAIQAEVAEATGHGEYLHICKAIWGDFLSRSNIAECCSRNPSGPLSPLYISARGARQPNHTIHFDGDVYSLQLRPGVPIRWVLDEMKGRGWLEAYERVGQLLIWLSHERHKAPKEHALPLLVDIYCSNSYLGWGCGTDLPTLRDLATRSNIPMEPTGALSPDTQRALAVSIGSHLQSLLRGHGNKKDVIRWHPFQDTPVCICCGSGSPS